VHGWTKVRNWTKFCTSRVVLPLSTVSHAEANLTRNQISHALLELLREIETQERENPTLQQELEAAISITQSKNVVSGSTITAGGNVHIGDKHVTQNAEKIYNIDKIDNANFS
jgi:hypothetical protein